MTPQPSEWICPICRNRGWVKEFRDFWKGSDYDDWYMEKVVCECLRGDDDPTQEIPPIIVWTPRVENIGYQCQNCVNWAYMIQMKDRGDATAMRAEDGSLDMPECDAKQCNAAGWLFECYCLDCDLYYHARCVQGK